MTTERRKSKTKALVAIGARKKSIRTEDPSGGAQMLRNINMQASGGITTTRRCGAVFGKKKGEIVWEERGKGGGGEGEVNAVVII